MFHKHIHVGLHVVAITAHAYNFAYGLNTRACFKEKSSLHISSANLQFTFSVFTPLFLLLHVYLSVFHLFIIHHYKNRLSSLRIFLHHCTFCASLLVKTGPGLYWKVFLPLFRLLPYSS